MKVVFHVMQSHTAPDIANAKKQAEKIREAVQQISTESKCHIPDHGVKICPHETKDFYIQLFKTILKFLSCKTNVCFALV